MCAWHYQYPLADKRKLAAKMQNTKATNSLLQMNRSLMHQTYACEKIQAAVTQRSRSLAHYLASSLILANLAHVRGRDPEVWWWNC